MVGWISNPILLVEEKLEDTKGVIKSRKPRRSKEKRSNDNLHNTTQKTKD
jgi:hypothetical protein